MNFTPRLSAALATLALASSFAACSNTAEVATASIVVTPTELAFPSVALGDSSTQSFAIANEGDATLHVTDLVPVLNTSFITTSWPGELDIAPGESVVIDVTYAPTGVTLTEGELELIHNDTSNSPFAVDITAVRSTPGLTVFPDPVDFGVVSEASTGEVIAELYSTGTAPLVLCDMLLTGSGDFASDIDDVVAAEGGYPIVLDPLREGGETDGLTLDVTYTPLSPGSDDGQLVLRYDSVGDPADACQNDDEIMVVNIPVVGEAGSPYLIATPCPIDFGQSSLDVGKELPVTLTNAGNIDIEVYDIRLNERSSGDFRVSAIPDFPYTMAPDDATTIVTTFQPTAYEARAGILEVEHSDGAGERTITSCSMSGVGVDNDCPIPVGVGRILQDDQARRAPEISWAIPLQTLILDASESFDANGDALSYEWRITEQPLGAVNGLRDFEGQPGNPAYQQYFIPIAGRYTFELTVIDDAGCRSEPQEVRVLAIPDEAISVELTWYNPGDPDENDREGADVDLHFVKVGSGAWFSDYDCYYGNPEPTWATELPSLDRDDTDGAGPEVIQLDTPAACGWYAVGVHYFAKRFDEAYATVRIYIDGVLTAEYPDTRLADTDDFWDVARIHWPSGTVLDVDEIVTDFNSRDNVVPVLPDELDPDLVCE